MVNLSVEEIIKATGGKLICGDVNTQISSVVIDSRKVKYGSLFVAFKGEKVDAHDFVSKAFEDGALAAIVEVRHDDVSKDGVLIEVENSKKALQSLAKYYRNKFNIPIVGVTGSVGKTTTKEMIYAALSETLDVLKTEGNYNGQLGLPLTLLNLEKNHQIAVIEMGVSEFGEMDILADIANVDMGVITNIGVSHIENFKKVENTRDEKLKLINKKEGKFFLNGDNPLLMDVPDYIKSRTTYFGLNGNYKYKAEDIFSNGESTSFVLKTNEFRETINIPCIGMHNVYNALAAISVAMEVGVHIDDIKKGLMKYKGLDMRQQILHVGNITIIDDSYNASPDSAKSAISVLRSLESDGKNIVVMADMLELGDESESVHKSIGRYMAFEGVDILITVGEMGRCISEGAESSGQSITVMHCENNKDAADKLLSFVSDGDKVLVKGSRGMHTEEIVIILKNQLKSE